MEPRASSQRDRGAAIFPSWRRAAPRPTRADDPRADEGARGGGARLALAGALLACAAASEARAQVFQTSERPETFLPLARDPAATSVTPIAFSASDDGDAVVALPFPVEIFGTTYTSVSVGTNGYVVFGGGRATRASNAAIGSLTSPDRLIAVWWDDLILPAASGYADLGVAGAPPHRVALIEVRDLEAFGRDGTPELHWQLRLHETPRGRIELRYSGTPAERYTATVGYVGPGGVPQGIFRPCGASADCDAAVFATLSGRAVTLEQVPGPDLLARLGVTPPGGLPGDRLPVAVDVENVGTEAALAGSVLTLHLSTDTALDARDPEVARLLFGAIPARARQTQTATLALPMGLALGRYRLLAFADALGAVIEPNESDNIALGSEILEVGYDLAVDAVSPVGLFAAPGERFEAEARLSESGLPFAGGVELVLHASPNLVPSGSDPVIARARVTLSALPTTVRLSGVVPAIGATRFWPVVRLDPSGEVADRDRSNQAAVASAPVLTAPNLQLSEVEPLSEDGAPGTALEVRGTVASLGVPARGDVRVALLASLDAVRDTLDPVLGSARITLGGAPSESFRVTVTVPALPPGWYHAVAVVDADDAVVEVVETDNAGLSDGRFATAPDLTVVEVRAPSIAAPGVELTPTVRVGRRGPPLSATVPLRIWLSEDEQLDPGDLDLGSFPAVFAGEVEVSVTPRISLPAGLRPAQWYVLAEIDPDRRIQEADETNNLGASRSRADGRRNLFPSVTEVSPTTIDPGEPVVVSFDVRSSPAPFVGLVEARILLSRDTALDATDLLLTSTVVSLAGTRAARSLPVTASASTAPGPWEVLVEVDPLGRIEETNEGDNVDDGFQTLTVRGPNLVVESPSTSSDLLAGERVELQFVLRNTGNGLARGVRYAYELYALGQSARALGAFGPFELAPGAVSSRRDEVRLPADISGTADLFVVVDPADAIAEPDEGDNRASIPVSIRARRPDLRPVLVRASTVAAAGEPWLVEWAVENLGLEAGAGAVGFVLAEGEEAAGERVSTATVSLDAGELTLVSTPISLPAGLEPGAYRLLVIADPDGALLELDETNNVLEGPFVRVEPARLRILSERLAPGLVGRRYAQQLEAVGGPFLRTWQVAPSTLPAGLSLDPSSGLLEGTPERPGRALLRVTVSSGAERASAELPLEVREAGAPLTLLLDRLPPAWVGQAYRAQVVAAGGVPPLRFEVAGLPTGFEASRAGVIEGRGDFPARAVVDVLVADAAGDAARRRVAFSVLDPEQRVAIAAAPLPEARLGVPYCEREAVELYALGGIPPLEWSASGLPEGLSLSPDGALCGTPAELGRFAVEARVTDAAGASDGAFLPLEVVQAARLVLETQSFSAIAAKTPVALRLTAAGGAPPYRYTLALGALPGGIALTEDGLLSGVPEGPGVFSFGVRVEDVEAAERVFPLSLEVTEAADPSGCRCFRRSARSRDLGSAVLLLLLLWGGRRTALSAVDLGLRGGQDARRFG